MTRPITGCLLLSLTVLSGCKLDLQTVADVPPEQAGDAGPWDAATAPTGPVKHPACNMARPAELPPEPLVGTDAYGRPLFDYWRDLPCDDPAVTGYPTCEEYRGRGDTRCQLCAGTLRLCQDDELGERVAGDGAPLVVSDSCTTCVPLEAKRRACCEGQDMFCGAWPYRGTAARGQPCAVHADCEPGLVCLDDPMSNGAPVAYGLCTCPAAAYRVTYCSMERVTDG